MGGDNTKLAEEAEALNKRLVDVEKELKEQRLKDKHEPKPCQKPKVAKTPWRKMEEEFSWSKEHEGMLKTAIGMHDTEDAVKNPRILLLGPVNAGKSSFINSVATIDKGRLARVAMVGDYDKSVTTKLKIYRPQRILKNFRILDTMGIEDEEGFNIEDITDLVAGKLKSNYKFNTRSTGDEADYKQKVEQKDQVHCIVVVVDANNIRKKSISDKTQEKINLLQQKFKVFEIPVIILLTKIDILCEDVEEDITNVFKSEEVKIAVKTAQEIFKVPEMNIHPIQNYSREARTETNFNILLLLALKQMINGATDYLNELNKETSSDEEESN